jgi:ParB/RepB/Spo0J family partition protein
MKAGSFDISDLANSLDDKAASIAKVSTPAVRRQKSTRLTTGSVLKKMILGNQRIFYHEIVEVGSVERRTSVFDLNERDQELLNEHGVADILPTIKRNKRNDFEAYARKIGNNFELADGSRRRRACVLGKAALLLWVCDDLTDREMEYLSDTGNDHKQASVYERGLKYNRWLESGRFTSASDIEREKGVARRTVTRCMNAAKLPKFLVEAFRTPNDMSVESSVKLHDVVTKNTIDIEILKKRAEAQKLYWDSTSYSGAEITKRIVAPVINPNDKRNNKKSAWLIKDKIKMTRTKTGILYELPGLTDDQQNKVDGFLKELLKK